MVAVNSKGEKQEQKKNTICLQNAYVVSSEGWEDADVQFDWKLETC